MRTINVKAAEELIKVINDNFNSFFKESDNFAVYKKYLDDCIDDKAKELLKGTIDDIRELLENYDCIPVSDDTNDEYAYANISFDITPVCEYIEENKDNITFTMDMVYAYVESEVKNSIKDCKTRYNDAEVVGYKNEIKVCIEYKEV